jgi:hypothetical protein
VDIRRWPRFFIKPLQMNNCNIANCERHKGL